MIANVSQFFHFKSESANSLHPSYSYFSLVPSPKDRGTIPKVSSIHLGNCSLRKSIELTLIKVTRMNQLMGENRANSLGQDIHPLTLNIPLIQLAESRWLIDSRSIPVTKHNDILALSFVRSSLDDVTGTLTRSRCRIVSHVRVASILISVHARSDPLQVAVSADDGQIIHFFRVIAWDL